MKKMIFALAVTVAVVLTETAFADAFDYEYTLSNFVITTQSVSVDVKNELDSEEYAMVYIAAYDEYNTLSYIKSVPVNVVQGQTTTVTQPLSTNCVTTVKIFIRKNVLQPCGKYIYKTTMSDGDIEFGGDL